MHENVLSWWEEFEGLITPDYIYRTNGSLLSVCVRMRFALQSLATNRSLMFKHVEYHRSERNHRLVYTCCNEHWPPYPSCAIQCC